MATRKIPLEAPFEETSDPHCNEELLTPTANRSSTELEALLPSAYSGPDHQTLRPEQNILDFLKRDLDVSRLSLIHKKLWIAGRPQNARPLHRQKMMRRQIVLTETADLHLTWASTTMFIKPLPRYVISHKFWTDYLCGDEKLRRAACGFLFSYTWLICSESDLGIAKEVKLVPEISWPSWRKLARDVRKFVERDPTRSIDDRYLYGELRLGRLNLIYRLYGWRKEYRRKGYSFIRAYRFDYRTYDSYFKENFAWILVVFLYVTVILTAMQVGLATDRLQKDSRFQNASSGFAIFSICVPAIAIAAAAIVFLVYFVDNWMTTHAFVKKKEHQWAQQRKVGQDV